MANYTRRFNLRKFSVWYDEAIATGEAPWLIYPFVPPSSFTLVTGQAKRTHKSWFMMTLGIAMSRPDGIFGFKPYEGKPRKGVLFELEGSTKRTQERFAALAASHGLTEEELKAELDPYFRIVTNEHLHLTSDDDFADLQEMVLKEELDYVVLDTMARSLGSLDENSASAMNRYLENIEKIKALGCAVICVHHVTKATNDQDVRKYDPDTALRGTGAIGGAMDLHMHLGFTDTKQLCLRTHGKDTDDFWYMFNWQVIGDSHKDEHGRDVTRLEQMRLEWQPIDPWSIPVINPAMFEDLVNCMMPTDTYSNKDLAYIWADYEILPKHIPEITAELRKENLIYKDGQKWRKVI